MTASQLEHLKLLDAHLDRLLKTASKRTHREWSHPKDLPTIVESESGLICGCSNRGNGYNDAAYIASCAGNAEAGWRSTKAAIAMLLEMESQGCSFRYFPTAESILAAWPLELITKQQ